MNIPIRIPNLEPIELQKLKQKLANLSCECHHCVNRRPSYDQGIQVEEPKPSRMDEFTQADPDIITRDHYNFLNTLTKDVLCPSCYLTMNLLRGGALKVLKDQESETVDQMLYCCDKTTSKNTVGLEKSTSVFKRLDFNLDHVTFDDYLTEYTSDTSVCKSDVKSTDKVVQYHDVGINEVHRDELLHGHSCVCLENFIDSIRPPLAGFVYPVEY